MDTRKDMDIRRDLVKQYDTLLEDAIVENDRLKVEAEELKVKNEAQAVKIEELKVKIAENQGVLKRLREIKGEILALDRKMHKENKRIREYVKKQNYAVEKVHIITDTHLISLVVDHRRTLAEKKSLIEEENYLIGLKENWQPASFPFPPESLRLEVKDFYQERLNIRFKDTTPEEEEEAIKEILYTYCDQNG
jgi:hypothetical protein